MYEVDDLLEAMAEEGFLPVIEAKHKGAPELRNVEREKAIKILSNAYVGKFPIKYMHSNYDLKRDRIVAQLELGNFKKSELEAFMKSFISGLNRKQKFFTFIFTQKGNYIFADVPKPKKSVKKEMPEVSKEALENFMVTDLSGEYMLEGLKNVPLVREYQKQGLSLEKAVTLMEARLQANPFLPMIVAQESMFKSEDEFDAYLMEAFILGLNACKFNYDTAAEAVIRMHYSPYEVSEESIHATMEAVTQNRGKIDRAVHTGKELVQKADNKVSPYVKWFLDTYSNLMGEEAVKEEVIKGGVRGWLTRWRRLFLKLLLVWKTAGIQTMIAGAAGAIVGFPWSMIIAGVLFVSRMWFYVDTIKTMAGFDDTQKKEAKDAIINELELELKLTREKIEDAKSAGNTKAKYELMRVEHKIEKEIYRIRYGKTPSEFRGE